MTILDKLASASGRKDERLNVELAHQIVTKSDKAAIEELISHLANKNAAIQNDCIKTLYEIASQKPSLVVDFIDQFIQLLESKNNRMQWGAMTALNHLTNEKPKRVYSVLGKLAHIADKGSVITRDNYVAILTKLCAIREFSTDAFHLLNEQLLSCPANQLPMYAENAWPAITQKNKGTFVRTLYSRLDDFDKESKRKRVEKVLKKLKAE